MPAHLREEIENSQNYYWYSRLLSSTILRKRRESVCSGIGLATFASVLASFAFSIAFAAKYFARGEAVHDDECYEFHALRYTFYHMLIELAGGALMVALFLCTATIKLFFTFCFLLCPRFSLQLKVCCRKKRFTEEGYFLHQD